MNTITIPEAEYFTMQKKIEELQAKISLLQDGEFMNKLMIAYKYFIIQTANIQNSQISLKRGSAKDVITYIAEDFTAPLDDFKKYDVAIL
jgi:delta-aminolevulinic acid dehydratase/porphobilinogen synthase